ncbi:hypothetical protein OA39_04216 [Vibrio campbellii]|nr:hypothetical protein OA39_04216 [Vibrio campbellii]
MRNDHEFLDLCLLYVRCVQLSICISQLIIWRVYGY